MDLFWRVCRKSQVPLDPLARRRQMMAGWTMEDMELVLQPMAQTGKEAIGSMGDDTPLGLANGIRTASFFRRFSQVTNRQLTLARTPRDDIARE